MAQKPVVISTRRLAISKANAQMVGIVAIASFVTVFCLVASKAVFSQNQYQSKVITAKTVAKKQLQTNIANFNTLVSHYDQFNSTNPNIIGGNINGSGDNDGDNSKIILDSLPSVYDFPALTSSVEKILTDRGFNVSSITGTDDQINQQNNTSSVSPQVVPMPFTFTVTNANYSSVSQLVTALQNSVRPIQIDSMTLSGGASNMTVTVNAHTYYQPGKSVSVTKKAIK